MESWDLGLGQLHPSMTEVRLPGSFYSPPGGLPSLRKLLAKRHGVSAEEVVVTTGASLALVSALASLDSDSEVAVPVPGFPAYPMMCSSLGLNRVDYSVADDLPLGRSRLWDRPMGAAIVNTPGNPLGNVIAEDQLHEIAGRTERVGTLLLLDLAYAAFQSRQPSLPKGERIVRVYSLGKELGLPGERVGYLIARPELASSLQRIHWSLAMGPPMSGMALAQRSLAEGVSFTNSVEQSLQTAIDALSPCQGIEVRRREGGIFLWIRAPSWSEGSQRLADACLEQGICVIPAAAFGSEEPAVRACAALGPSTHEAFARLGSVLTELLSSH